MSKSIVKACVRYNDRLYTGFDHGECFKKLNEDNTILIHSDIEQGFVDSDGNFVDRKQAMIIAKENGQLAYETDKKTLISEDLHLDWLNKQAQRISELEEQLKNAIVPKFKYGQDVWCVYPTNEHRQGFVFELEFVGYTKDKIICCITENEEFEYDEVFETKAEAKAKLQELQEK